MFSRYGWNMLRRMSALADVVDDRDVAGLSVVLSWLKPSAGRPGSKAVNETFFTLHRQGHCGRLPGEAGVGRGVPQPGQVNLFDGQDLVGRVPIEVWEDSFNSTYKATNYDPPKGATCP